MGADPRADGETVLTPHVHVIAHHHLRVTVLENGLAEWTQPGGMDDEPATVLVWRDRDGRPVHAAIMIADGWLIHKPSQGWMPPHEGPGNSRRHVQREAP